MQDRKQKIKGIYVILIIGLFAAACVYLHLQTDSIIIRNGIRFYRKLRTGVLSVGGILSILVLVLYGLEWRRRQIWQKEKDEKTAQMEVRKEEMLREQEKHKEVLSVSKKMDAQKIQELLLENAAEKWHGLSQQLLQIRMQMNIMDEYEEKLSHLLDVNGAAALANTEDVLDRVEQYLCKNVRKVLNYMDVADNDSDEAVRQVERRLQICHEEGQKQLQQVQEFLFALAEFLNKQGEDDNSMEMLDIYKSTILSSIESEMKDPDA